MKLSNSSRGLRKSAYNPSESALAKSMPNALGAGHHVRDAAKEMGHSAKRSFWEEPSEIITKRQPAAARAGV